MDENGIQTGAKIEELVVRVFGDRNAANLAHWSTNSLAQHMATGDFYDSVIEKIDQIVECFQGKFGKIGALPMIPSSMNANIVQRLSDTEVWIGENAESVANGLESVENLIADLQGIYNSTLYKLNNLS